MKKLTTLTTALLFALSAYSADETVIKKKKKSKKQKTQQTLTVTPQQESLKSTSTVSNSTIPAASASSSTSLSSSSMQGQTSTSISEVKPTTPWSGGATFIAERAATVLDPNDPQNSDLDTQLHLKLGYKLKNGNKLTANQRIFYSIMTRPDKQYLSDPEFASLRLEYSIPNDIGAGGTTVFRMGVPTTQAVWDANALISVAVMPNLNWAVANKTTVSYSGYLGGLAYTGNALVVPAGMQDSLRDKTISQAEIDSYLSANGPQRSFIYMVQTVGASYDITDKLSLSGSLGYSFGLKDFSDNNKNLKKRTGAFELGASVDVAPAKNMSVSAGVSQAVADMPRAKDLITGKDIYFDNYAFALFRPEQTTYNLSGSLTF